jgi:hypothetical protein
MAELHTLTITYAYIYIYTRISTCLIGQMLVIDVKVCLTYANFYIYFSLWSLVTASVI